MSHRRRKRKKKNVNIATNIDEAYTLYLKLHDNRAPTASRFKKFINDDKRVQMNREIDFVTADNYLRSSGKGRTPSGPSSRNASPSKTTPRKRRTTSIMGPSTTSKTPKKKSKHYRGTRSVDLDLNKKLKRDKSRDERPIASIAEMSALKPSKYKKKTGQKSRKGRKGLAKIKDTTEPYVFQLPGDDELAALISSLPDSPVKTSTAAPMRTKSAKEIIDTDTAVLKSFPFCEHMKDQHAGKLQVNDNIDHRFTNGLYMQALIVQKNGSKFKIRYGNNRNNEIWSDYKYELYRFAKFRSITLRPTHRMLDIRSYDTVMVNPRRFKRKGKGWRKGVLVKKDYKSGQVQVEYEYKRRKYTYWTHLDSIKEIRPYAPMTQAVVQSVPTLDLNANVHVESEEKEKTNTEQNMNNNNIEFDLNVPISEQLRRATQTTKIQQTPKTPDTKDIQFDLNIPISEQLRRATQRAKAEQTPKTPDTNHIEFDLNVPISEQLMFATERSRTQLQQEQKGEEKVEEKPYKGEQKRNKQRIEKVTKIETIELDFNNVHGWKTDEVTYWLCSIENGRFGKKQRYAALRKGLKDCCVCGDELLQINHVFLRMMGVIEKKDRKLILKHIEIIVPKQKAKANVKNGMHQNKMSEMELEQGIKKATQQYNKENKKLQKDILKLEEVNKQIRFNHTRKSTDFSELQTLYDTVKKQKDKPTKELLQLRQQNKTINDELKKLTTQWKQQETQLKTRKEEAARMRKEINKKDEMIATVKSEKHEEITEFKMKLSTLKKKYETLNMEYTKQKQRINDVTKDSYYENERALLNGSMTIDTSLDVDINDEKETHTMTQFEGSPESVRSEDTINSCDAHDCNIYEESDEIRTIIIDNGSESIKLGYGQCTNSESHKPSKKFQSIVGRAKSGNTYSSERDVFVGDEAYNKSSILHTTNVLQRGNVMNWDFMEQLWDYTFYKKLAIPRSQRLTNHNVLLTECIGRRKQERHKAVQVMFETFDTHSMFMVNEAALSLYGVGKVTGTVLGIGYGVTYAACIYEGTCIPQTMLRINSAGYDITKFLKQSLNYSAVLNTTKHSIIKDMKQKYCFVANNFHESLKEKANKYKRYKLPDGQTVRIGNERFIACEQLFNGFMGLNNDDMVDDHRSMFAKNAGIQHVVHASINAVPDDELKQELYSTGVVLSGGSTLFKGLGNRLQTEIYKLSQQQIGIVANEKRKYLAWIGGSILSSLENCRENFIQRSEYDECGPSIVDRKCA